MKHTLRQAVTKGMNNRPIPTLILPLKGRKLIGYGSQAHRKAFLDETDGYIFTQEAQRRQYSGPIRPLNAERRQGDPLYSHLTLSALSRLELRRFGNRRRGTELTTVRKRRGELHALRIKKPLPSVCIPPPFGKGLALLCPV